jgi:hypothetical protein
MKLSVIGMALAAMIFTSAEPAWAQVVRIDPAVRTMASDSVQPIRFGRGGGGGGGFRHRGFHGGGARFGGRGGYARGGYRGGYARRGGYGYRGGYAYRGGYGYRRYGYGVGAGLAAGALVGGAVAASRGYGDGGSYCASRYGSYDPGSGTYLGYDGLRHPCP